MPVQTPKLGINKPLGNETVSRQSFNNNWDRIDKMAVREPFLLESALYDSVGNKIDITLGPGRADFLGTLVAKDTDTVYSISAPAVNTNYYVYLKSDGTFTHNTTGGEIAGAVPIWRVSTGATVDAITIQDLRGELSGTAARVVRDQLDAHKAAADPHPQYAKTTHASTHASGGSDPITPAQIGAVSKSGDIMSGTLVFDNGLSDSPEIMFNDPINNTHAYIDIYNETLRALGRYRNGSEILFLFEYDMKTKTSRTFGNIIWHSGNLMTTANITYYVDAVNGNDANNGLSASTAFKTIQKAVNSIPRFVDHDITIQLADGTYNETVTIGGFVGRGSIVIQGNITTPTNVKVNKFNLARNTCLIKLQYLEITSTTYDAVNLLDNKVIALYKLTIQTPASYNGIATSFSDIRIDNCVISNRGVAIMAIDVSRVYSVSNSGNGNNYGLYAINGGVIAKSGTQPTGTTNEYVGSGGVIR